MRKFNGRLSRRHVGKRSIEFALTVPLEPIELMDRVKAVLPDFLKV
jgi:hypothetical protein